MRSSDVRACTLPHSLAKLSLRHRHLSDCQPTRIFCYQTICRSRPLGRLTFCAATESKQRNQAHLQLLGDCCDSLQREITATSQFRICCSASQQSCREASVVPFLVVSLARLYLTAGGRGERWGKRRIQRSIYIKLTK